jgi:hypothetical protein
MYVYFVPREGFNDILCATRVVIEYCKKYNRTLLIDGTKSCYKINFGDYFTINQDIIVDTVQIKKICSNTSYTIYPNDLQNKMSDILEEKIKYKYIDRGVTYNKERLELPEQELSENIIVYSACGGVNGHKVFNQLIFNATIIDIVNERVNKLNKPYLCVQIRNTDRSCDYISFFNENENKIRSYKEIYIATDNKKIIEFYKEKGLNVKNFTTFPEENYVSLHKSNIDNHTKFVDMICDIFIISLSHELLSNSLGGFIKLVKNLQQKKM